MITKLLDSVLNDRVALFDEIKRRRKIEISFFIFLKQGFCLILMFSLTYLFFPKFTSVF